MSDVQLLPRAVPTTVQTLCARLRHGATAADCAVADDLAIHLMKHLTAQAKADFIEALTNQVQPRDLTVSLNNNTCVRHGVVVQLSPNQASLLFTLNNKYPLAASAHDLAVAVWGAKHCAMDLNTIRVMLTNMRRKLEVVRVGIVNDWGRGYRLALAPMGV
jgi:DNA-binding response OmpR family regulator